ncbi:hypothetical protein ACN6Q6_19700, partial [Acinetobacter baumannii]|uniref:hypothetical protein n=1 Tax=Acinetobacter baumannii TaxID=470 RepID=UPI003AFA61B6
MSKNLATLIGLSAILMWASMVGFVKHITTAIGPDVGITLIYSLSALLLLIIFCLLYTSPSPRDITS